MTERLILVGGGAFARELINWTQDAMDAAGKPGVAGFLDVSPNALDGFSYGVPWLGDIDDYVPQEGDRFVMAIGDPVGKRTVARKLRAKGARFATIVHPTAIVARSAKLGEGVVVCPLSIVSADAQVGDLVAINSHCGIGHDVRIGDFSTLSGFIDLTGWVQVGEAVFFGSGARVLPKTKIGDEARIGAGAIIMRAVPAGVTMYAPPAKKL
ncbi:acetyltransferase [Bordetella sp. LUAb4]|uniref:acetyltransferase n=1 Tax=Bordetella sp. LUAb4 TaxID=2843195 RepID=UPI001E5FC63F|nr:acetyltransferase [Bordetella sp. LUAb4]